ncbi:MAG: long-chain fatty acid--CoA ligase [Ardenticatenaceae bacterium]|nr:long-chain fatty acid--CoA ligase [Anaerolineales bacterium]MCB8921175.1 long-chain fatty acid--CoA ligase [Ardenticatenaceae bacterium]MCB8990877.1 long-chain fatty acid--CoA ligase [Ardenticatenaceae bacterium]MCB9004426.1 long-chain fatty acid--CoA ligase [Ardenticatenaceae bacterium]
MSSPYAEKPWLKRYDEGIPEAVDVPDYPLHHFLEEAARNYPDNTAVIFKGRRISYRQLNAYTDAVAAGLAANGFKKGDRAVIYMPNTPQFIISYFGILKAGGIAIATNPLYTERELEHQLSDCGAETVFVMSRFYPQLKTVQSKRHTQVKRVIVTNVKEYFPAHLNILFTLLKEKKEGDRVQLESGDMWFQDFLAQGSRAPKPNVTVTGDDIALLQYTGGTTGLAKGAVGLHRSLVSNALSLQTWIDWEPGKEGFLAAIPFFHVYGMITAMVFSISVAGQQIVIVNPRDQKDLLSSINKYQPAIFPGVPALYNAINRNPDVAAGKYNIRSIRACISGSAPLLLETKRRFEELTGGTLVEGFGMTETFVATHANPIKGENREGSIGLPIPNVECRILDVDDGVTEMPVGEEGEMVIKSPSVMQGYWKKDAETKNSLRDGWLYSGDIGKMDEDGYFYITDRKKDMIIAGGYNIYPREVEEVLMTHPAVVEVSVAGVKDAYRGETVKAWVVKKEGDATTEEEIIEWSKGQLAKYKYPRLVEFRDELPKTTVGKVLKRELRKQHEEAQKKEA